MFTKTSRYFPGIDISVVDAQGRQLTAKALRPTSPQATAGRHRINQGDRLHALAHTYYRESTRWWRICDANPDILSPLELLNGGPLLTLRLPLSLAVPNTAPPWAGLLAALEALPGVDDVLVDEVLPAVEDAVPERAVIVHFFRHSTDEAEIADAIAALGFDVGPAQHIGRVGKELRLPPRIAGG